MNCSLSQSVQTSYISIRPLILSILTHPTCFLLNLVLRNVLKFAHIFLICAYRGAIKSDGQKIYFIF
jgi:hypothetical protein